MAAESTAKLIEDLALDRRNGSTRSIIFVVNSVMKGCVKSCVRCRTHALGSGIVLSEATLNTPYVNTIAPSDQPIYPGDIELEKRIENIVRWNAMAMVLRAQDDGTGVGGHMATYASAATMMK